MTVALWILGLTLALWVFICAVIWIWFFFLGGEKQDASGDMGIAIILLPIVPFVMIYFKIQELFEKKTDTTPED